MQFLVESQRGKVTCPAITPLPFGSLSCEVTDETNRPLGWLVVDATVNGRSHGGLRLAQGVSLAELRVLARRMTLKFGFLGLPRGGAKAGVLGNPEAAHEQRMRHLRRFAAVLAPLLRSGCYQPWPDLGTSEPEIDAMLASVGVRRSRREPTRVQSSFYTALTVVVGAQVAARHLGCELAGLRVGPSRASARWALRWPRDWLRKERRSSPSLLPRELSIIPVVCLSRRWSLCLARREAASFSCTERLNGWTKESC